MFEHTPNSTQPGYLSGQLLVATPLVMESCFHKSVIYVCAHSEDGAMGVLINQVVDNLTVEDVLDQLGIESNIHVHSPIYFGGPVEPARGFVLHTADYFGKDTLEMPDGISLTANTDILHALANGNGPRESLFTLGYAGWGPGQLEAEIERNSWITVKPSRELIFGTENAKKWYRAAAAEGIDLAKLSPHVGRA